jgi:hypothetical protein
MMSILKRKSSMTSLQNGRMKKRKRLSSGEDASESSSEDWVDAKKTPKSHQTSHIRPKRQLLAVIPPRVPGLQRVRSNKPTNGQASQTPPIIVDQVREDEMDVATITEPGAQSGMERLQQELTEIKEECKDIRNELKAIRDELKKKRQEDSDVKRFVAQQFEQLWCKIQVLGDPRARKSQSTRMEDEP